MSSPGYKGIKIAYGTKLAPTGQLEFFYKVIVVNNSTEFYPGQFLKKAQVDELCNSPKWNVVIVSLKE